MNTYDLPQPNDAECQPKPEEAKRNGPSANQKCFCLLKTLILCAVIGSIVGSYVLVFTTKTNSNLGERELEQLATELHKRLNQTEGPSNATEQGECKSEIELRNALQKLQERLARAEAAINPKSCRDVAPRYANDTGGVYTIYPLTGGRQGIKVFCDLVTDGGGWLVFQKRKDGSENFDRGWDDYVNGFGKLDGEFWLGLDNLHLITNSDHYALRIDMEDFEGTKVYGYYGNFSVGSGIGYTFTRGSYSGSAGDSMSSTGTRFSTKDRDQDMSSGHCAQTYKGGWWFAACHVGNPNGYYYGGPHDSFADGVCWESFRGFHYSLKTMELKIKKT